MIFAFQNKVAAKLYFDFREKFVEFSPFYINKVPGEKYL